MSATRRPVPAATLTRGRFKRAQDVVDGRIRGEVAHDPLVTRPCGLADGAADVEDRRTGQPPVREQERTPPRGGMLARTTGRTGLWRRRAGFAGWRCVGFGGERCHPHIGKREATEFSHPRLADDDGYQRGDTPYQGMPERFGPSVTVSRRAATGITQPTGGEDHVGGTEHLTFDNHLPACSRFTRGCGSMHTPHGTSQTEHGSRPFHAAQKRLLDVERPVAGGKDLPCFLPFGGDPLCCLDQGHQIRRAEPRQRGVQERPLLPNAATIPRTSVACVRLQRVPPDMRIFTPGLVFFSRSSTLNPRSAPRAAASRPAGPAPITTTSHRSVDTSAPPDIVVSAEVHRDADLVNCLELRLGAYPKTRVRWLSNPPILGRRAGVRGFSDPLLKWCHFTELVEPLPSLVGTRQDGSLRTRNSRSFPHCGNFPTAVTRSSSCRRRRPNCTTTELPPNHHKSTLPAFDRGDQTRPRRGGAQGLRHLFGGHSRFDTPLAQGSFQPSFRAVGILFGGQPLLPLEAVSGPLDRRRDIGIGRLRPGVHQQFVGGLGALQQHTVVVRDSQQTFRVVRRQAFGPQ